MDLNKQKEYQQLAFKMRKQIIGMLHNAGSGHAGGSMSELEILISLYYEIMNIDPKNPKKVDRDRFILSKGHASPGLYTVLANKGYFNVDELSNLRKFGSILQGHPCMNITPGVDFSTGSLGQGLSAGIGMALAMEQDNMDAQVYVLIGDGELNEGQNWEAMMFAAKMKLDKLVAILDYNKVQLDGTADEIMPMEPIVDKWQSFGWNVVRCDGHNIANVTESLVAAKEYSGKPTVVIADTVKGKGITFMENKNTWHGKPIDDEHFALANSLLSGGLANE